MRNIELSKDSQVPPSPLPGRIGGIRRSILFFLPLSFLIEKELYGIPLHVVISVLAALLVLRKGASGLKNIGLIEIFVVYAVNGGILLAVGYDATARSLLLPFVYLVYFLFLMWVFGNLITDEVSFDAYLLGLKTGFLIVILVYCMQILSILGVYDASKINDALASIYEARWAPFKSMGEVHGFYVKGSYASTLERVNGLSKEASTFSIGVALNFVVLFMSLYSVNYKNCRNKYHIYTLICIVMMFTSRSSSGTILSILTLIFILLNYKSISMRIVCSVVIVAFVIAFLGDINDNRMLGKLSDLTNISTQTRYASVYAGIAAIADQPFLGRGMLYYAAVYEHIPSWGFSYELVNYYNRENMRVFSVPVALYGEFGPVVLAIIFVYFFKVAKIAFFKVQGGRCILPSERYEAYFMVYLIASIINTSAYSHPFYYSSLAMSFVMMKNGREIFKSIS